MHTELNAKDTTNQLLDDQINQQNIELENKRQQIFNARMDIVRSQGQQNWKAEPVRADLPTRNNNTTDSIY